MPRLSTTRRTSNHLQLQTTQREDSEHISVLGFTSLAEASWQLRSWCPPGFTLRDGLYLLPNASCMTYICGVLHRNNSNVHRLVQAQLPCSLFSTTIKRVNSEPEITQQVFAFPSGAESTPLSVHGEPQGTSWHRVHHSPRQRFLPKSELYEREKVLQSAHGSPPNWDTSSTEAQWFRLKHLWGTAPMGAPEGEKLLPSPKQN